MLRYRYSRFFKRLATCEHSDGLVVMGNLTLNTPLMPPPDGVQSNYVDPEDQTIFIITSNVLCLVFVTVFVALRLYTKVFIARRISLDDCATLST